MLVYIELRQCADIDLELAGIVEHLRELGIQAVDPLDDEDIVLSQLFRGPRIPPLPGLEVKNRQIDFFSLQERLHVFIKLFYIDSFQTFKIII